MRVGLATIQFGRSRHLARQAHAVARLGDLQRYVIVSMDPDPPNVPEADVVHLPTLDPAALPLAAARNRAIRELDDMDLVVMLDVDCIPDPDILGAYRAAIGRIGFSDALLVGSVGYLDTLSAAQLELAAGDRHQARDQTRRPRVSEQVARHTRFELFWSLSYAVRPRTHHRIGGFDERYAGYGAEDTDYGFRARERGCELWDVTNAWAYHQPHAPAGEDSTAHAAIVANLNRFHRTWGTWPMPDWIRGAVDRGEVAWRADGTLTAIAEGGQQRGEVQTPRLAHG